ncbi:hypothetical protein LIER_30616 [Lithospermum erythrorhizon]|uniref:Retrotransposon protein n=1 Tax=Lithospermum erythrorhizon TaxID=34254 RepID=A0AAV3RQ91_LITER
MDFIFELLRTSSKNDGIWVIVDILSKSAHFLPIKSNHGPEQLARLYVDQIVRLHGVSSDGQSERTIQILEDMLRACMLNFSGNWDDELPKMEFAYNNSFHDSIEMAPFEALYGRKCRTLLCWNEVGDKKVHSSELMETSVERMKLIKKWLKAAQDRQKMYEDRRRVDLMFEVGDKVFLRISPWKEG